MGSWTAQRSVKRALTGTDAGVVGHHSLHHRRHDPFGRPLGQRVRRALGHHQHGHPLVRRVVAAAAADRVVLQEQVEVELPARLERQHGPHGDPDEHVRGGVEQTGEHDAVERRPEHDDGVVQQRALGRDDGQQGQHAGAVRHQAGVRVGHRGRLAAARLPFHEAVEPRVTVVVHDRVGHEHQDRGHGEQHRGVHVAQHQVVRVGAGRQLLHHFADAQNLHLRTVRLGGLSDVHIF